MLRNFYLTVHVILSVHAERFLLNLVLYEWMSQCLNLPYLVKTAEWIVLIGTHLLYN